MNPETLVEEIQQQLPSVLVQGEEGLPSLSAAAGHLVVCLEEGSAAATDDQQLCGGLADLEAPLRTSLQFARRHVPGVSSRGAVTGPLALSTAGGGAPLPLLLLGLGPKELAPGSSSSSSGAAGAVGAVGAELLEPQGRSRYQEAGAALAAALKQQTVQQVTLLLDATPLTPPAGAQPATTTTSRGQPPSGSAAAAAVGLLSGLLGGLYSCTRHHGTPHPATPAAAAAAAKAQATDKDGSVAAAGGGGGSKVSGQRHSVVQRVVLVLRGLEVSPAAGEKMSKLLVARAMAVWLARTLVDAPANLVTPAVLGEVAASLPRLAPPGAMTCTLLDREGCAAAGLGLLLGVAQGSELPPCLIHLTYDSTTSSSSSSSGVEQDARGVALVGKGLTFDSGGYNLKVAGGIEEMKVDMAGAAAVLGAAALVARMGPSGLKAHFISAACENMVGSRATHPSDIHTSGAGLTVEVNDTDAEGRLTLADALWYAQQVAGAGTLVDIATLTGACGIALGTDTGGLWANDNTLAAQLLEAGRGAGEKLWRMPLTRSLRPRLDSTVADIKNYAGRPGGAITAALFLSEFITPGTAWAHIDMAGPAWDAAAGLSTGYGAATLGSWLLQQAGPAQ